LIRVRYNQLGTGGVAGRGAAVLSCGGRTIVDDDQGSVTRWIGALFAEGDRDEAAQALWERYYVRLVALAAQRLRAAPRQMADEEDAALAAFDSFCQGAAAGRYPRLGGREDLWRLLVVITGRKVLDQVAHERARRRDRRRLLDEARLEHAGPDPRVPRAGALAQIVGREPSPEFAGQVAEQCRNLLARLESPGLRDVAVLKMEGYRNEEIARRMSCSVRAVERKLNLIRKTWQRDGAA
jgi:DNA-directed RNA polymerase specialized sigma24 family protein